MLRVRFAGILFFYFFSYLAWLGELEARHHLHDHQDGLLVHVRYPVGQGPVPREDQRADHLRHHYPGMLTRWGRDCAVN